jgi:hypothetical protein
MEGILMKRQTISWSLLLMFALPLFFSAVSLAGQGGVSGLVLDANDLTPASNVTVVLQNDAVRVTTTTDMGGIYFFQGLPAGDYELYVSSDDYLRLPKTVTVSADQDAVVDFAAIPVEVLEQSQEALSAGAENTAATGTWKGNWRDDGGSPHGKLTLNADFSGNKINGAMIVTNTGCGILTIPCSGTLSDHEFHLVCKITNQCLGGKRRFVLDGILSPSGTKITGDIEDYKGNKHTGHSTFTLRKK